MYSFVVISLIILSAVVTYKAVKLLTESKGYSETVAVLSLSAWNLSVYAVAIYLLWPWGY
jgi:hypothetical protein